MRRRPRRRPVVEMLRNYHALEGAVICVDLAREKLCSVATEYDGSPELLARLQRAATDFRAACLAEDIATKRRLEWREANR